MAVVHVPDTAGVPEGHQSGRTWHLAIPISCAKLLGYGASQRGWFVKYMLFAAVALGFATMAQAEDAYAPMYGNTLHITAPGGTKTFIYVNPDMTWEEHLTDGTVMKGTYYWRDAKHACFITLQPPPRKSGEPPVCVVPEARHKVGDVWTYKDEDGISTLRLTAGRPAAAPARTDGQPNYLVPVTNVGTSLLRFNWPDVRIGTAEYEAGPTGVTVFYFPHRALGAIDVRGGAPGTVNSDFLRLGYDDPELDAIVFAGGSWYGLETVTAVASALKDDGLRNGDIFSENPGIALSIGSIIYDFGPRRLNEIYPDKQLAQAAFRAARPGIFPLGAQGAGRFATTGSYFGCDAYSGEGGAFRQIGKLKIAAFTVVNAYGVVTRPDGRLAVCYRDPKWPKNLTVSDLLGNVPMSTKEGWADLPPDRHGGNTTVSLVITNEKLAPSELRRLAVQVHTSMAREIQPFSSEDDGDVLYAVSTGELTGKDALSTTDLGTVASEVMQDAVYSSIPKQTQAAAEPHFAVTASALENDPGNYFFSPFVSVHITANGGKLYAHASGARDAYAIPRKGKVALVPVSEDTFMVPGRYPLTLKFSGPGLLVINPGHWAQVGMRQHD